jgi:Double zinc ribbon
VHPHIPPKKLEKCKESFCFSDAIVDFLLDDTVFGSAAEGMAISNGILYYKALAEDARYLDLSSAGKFTFKKRMFGTIDLSVDGQLFFTATGFDKKYQDYLIEMLNAAADAAKLAKSKAECADPPAPIAVQAEPMHGITCKGCQASMPPASKFCPECGTKVPAKGHCNECDEELPEAAKFCPKCGASADVRKPPVKPATDVNALREQLSEWLAGAEQEALIDSDGDMSFRINQTKPDFASGYRAWSTKYDISVSSEGKSQEQTDTACFSPDDDFSVGSPYCRIGRLASAQYQGSINASFFVLKNVEVHEIELKEGHLQIPKLGSNKISISSLSARKDDDGSFGVEYELSAYPGHIVSFEISSEKPEDDASAWGLFEEEPTQTGTSWLWDVKPGQKIYLTFGEFEPLVDGVQASFSGEARPSEGAYDSNEACESTWSDDVPSSGNEDVDTILQAAAERMLELDWFEDSLTNGGNVQKLALFLSGEPDEFKITARMGVADRQDELDEDELQETRSAIDTYFDLNDIKVQLSSRGYDWSGLAGIECEISLLEGESGGSRGFGGQGSDSGDSVTGYFEWHMFRGSVNIDDMEDEDERDAAEQAAVLVEQGDQEGALQALPALWFEYNMDNLDSSPDELMPSGQQVYFEANYANPDHDIVLDYEDGTLIVTATIRFPMQVNAGVDEDEINDWLSENGGYAAGFLSANWSYNGDEGGHFVFREFADDEGY